MKALIETEAAEGAVSPAEKCPLKYGNAQRFLDANRLAICVFP
jgi:hypothetical protein